MNKMGNMGDERIDSKRALQTIRNSYVYKLVKRVFSLVTTLLLIMLLSLGGLMFYFNMKAQAAAKQGQQYIAPFGLYTIISGSMEPNISVYDVVASVQVDDLSTIKIGDVITFISTWELNYGTTVTHRVVNIIKGQNGDYSFVTKGDANNAQDGAYVNRDNLVGKVLFKIPQLGRVQFFLATKMGWFVVVFVPALAVIIWDIVKIFRLKVLRKEITYIKPTEEAKKTYFEGETLDSRDIEDIDLQKTTIISKDALKKKTSSTTKKSTSVERKPIPKRESTKTPQMIKPRKKLK